MTPPPSLQDLIDTVQRDSPSDDLLDLLVTASTTVSELEQAGDALLGHFVDRCRRAGRSWSEISGALGVSKQAVHKRFSASIADRMISSATAPTLERFTDRARAVLTAADHAARELNRDRVGSEHVLLGLFAAPAGPGRPGAGRDAREPGRRAGRAGRPAGAGPGPRASPGAGPGRGRTTGCGAGC
jgi:hypothetical protein